MKCEKLTKIRICNVSGDHLHLHAKKLGLRIDLTIGSKVSGIIKQYSHTESIRNSCHSEVPIKCTPDEAIQVRRICQKLGVSVSDFLKITLYNELNANKKGD
jgi:hypothetical protein